VLKSGITLLADGGVVVVDAQGLGRCTDGSGPVGDITIDGFHFINGTGLEGGALLIHADAPAVVSNCEISGCSADVRGGGISYSLVAPLYSSYGLTLDHVVMQNNSADRGGAAYIAGSCSMKDCTFTANVAATYGGSIKCANSGLTIRSSVIEDSQAAMGGGLSVVQGGLSMDDCIIRNNHATSQGGGVYASFSSLGFTDCEVVDNSAGLRAGGIDGMDGDIYGQTSTFRNSRPDIAGIVSNGYCTFNCCDVAEEVIMSEHIEITNDDCPVAAEAATFSDIKRAYR